MKSVVGNRHVLALHIAQATPKLEAQLQDRDGAGGSIGRIVLYVLLGIAVIAGLR